MIFTLISRVYFNQQGFLAVCLFVGMMSQVGNPTSQDSRRSEDGDRENCAVREQARFLPIANITRIMRKVLPTHVKISEDAKETIQECVSEYIGFITGEANERCKKEHRKTISAEDVLWAMKNLGCDDYVEPLTIYLEKFRTIEREDRGEPLPKNEMNIGPNLPAGSQMSHPALYGTSGMVYYVNDSATSSNPYTHYQ